VKVRKTSWHYRLWKWGRENEQARPRDLCRYFWHIALVKILLPGVALGFCILGVVSLGIVIWNHPWETLGMVAFAAAVAALGMGLYLYQKSQNAKVAERVEPKAPKEPGPLREYLAARKRKVCPLIEVEDG
jgi:hypothetical protein